MICVVTGTRAEYGLLQPVMELIRNSGKLEFQLVVTGTHLSSDFGLTHRDIEKDGFVIDRKVDMRLESDTPVAVTKSIGYATIGFADAFNDLHPDLVLLVGDRFEILAAATAALVARIPVGHIHGGEATEGAFDEAIRHAVTKMSHLHFVATEEYKRRVEQLGEDPSRVFVVGGLGVDVLRNLELLGRDELESHLGVKLGGKSLLITFHPATLDDASAADQMKELLAALDSLPDATLIFTMPNADPEGKSVSDLISRYCESHANARAFQSLGTLRYLSTMAQVDGVVGNSSSGLLEAPTLGKGTVNIGTRQSGRAKAASVIDCAADRESIKSALNKLFSKSFNASLAGVKNPYGDGGAGEAIVKTLENERLDGILRKKFFDR